MTFSTWLSIVAVCTAGAMSPGPSLAVVIRNTLHGNKIRGVITGLSHAIGIVFYAFITAIGVGVAVIESPALFSAIKLAGAGFLVWLAIAALTSSARRPDFDLNELVNSDASVRTPNTNPVLDGILISILNPKIIVFFLALFSQFVRPEASIGEAVSIAITAGVIDAGWYTLVAVFISYDPVYRFLRKNLVFIEKLFGILLILIALRVVF